MHSQTPSEANEQPGSPSVAGVILAAGESRRMGKDKALLSLGGESFLQRELSLLQGNVSPIFVVLGHHAQEIAAGIRLHPDVRVLYNPDYALGQLSSLQVALRALAGEPVSGALVCLVDHPAIIEQVIAAILECFEKTGAPVVIPTYGGRRGHPVLFSRRLFAELLHAPLEEGARPVVRRHSNEVELVETNWEGILWDVDRPFDYERLLARWNSIILSGRWPS